MKIYSERIRTLRASRNVSQSDLANTLGVSRSTVGMYETGKREPDLATLDAIADFFNVDMDYLLGRSNIERRQVVTQNGIIPAGFEPMPEMDTVPLIGHIACGNPITAEENIEDTVSVPAAWHADFTLRCEGASMEPRIQDGDLVAIRKQPEVENGEIAAVRIGDEATLKHVYYYPSYIELRPENPAFASIIKIGPDMNDVHIEGKAVGLCRGL